MIGNKRMINYLIKLLVLIMVIGLLPIIRMLSTSVYASENMISNGDFSNGQSPWSLELSSGGDATWAIEDGWAKVNIAAGGAQNRVMLRQTLGANLVAGKQYTYVFTVKTTAASKKFDVAIRDANDGFIDVHYSIYMYTTERTYEYTFRPATDQAGAEFELRLGFDTSPVWVDNVMLYENPDIIIDNVDSDGCTFDSSWGTPSTYGTEFYGINCNLVNASPGKWAKYTPNIITAGGYDVYLWWASGTNRASAVPLEISYDGGIDTSKTVDQRTNGAKWVYIGNYNFAAGTSGYVKINASSVGYTVADAVKFVYNTATSTPTPTPTPDPNQTPTPTPGVNLITNGSFSSGTSPWFLSFANGGAADLSVDNGWGKVDITSAGTEPATTGNVMLRQRLGATTTLTAGTQYTYSFKIKAEAHKRFDYAIRTSSYGWIDSVTYIFSETSEQTITRTFTPDADQTNAIFELRLGADASDVWVTDVMLYEGLPATTPTPTPDPTPTPTPGNVPIASITMDPVSLSIWRNFEFPAGRLLKPAVTITPANASVQTLSWSSDNEAVATVDENGNITLAGVGTANITAAATDGSGKSATMALTVTEPQNRPANQKLNLAPIVSGSPRLTAQDVNKHLGWPENVGEGQIALWSGNKTGAYTMTVDDSKKEDFAKWKTYTEDFGFPYTFFVMTDYDRYEKPVGNHINDWLGLTAAGESVQSHTRNHYSSTQQAGLTSAQIIDDFAFPIRAINESVYNSESKTRTLALSYGTYVLNNLGEFARRFYIAARGVSGQMNKAGEVDYSNVGSISIAGGTSISKLRDSVNKLDDTTSIYYGGWSSFHCHGLDYTSQENSELAVLLGDPAGTTYLPSRVVEYFNENIIGPAYSHGNGWLWVDHFDRVVMYAQERDTATLTVTSVDENYISYTLTDEMDDTMFDFPLTVKFKVDPYWTDITAVQDTGDGMVELDIKVVMEGSNKYVMVETVPDRGTVTLSGILPPRVVAPSFSAPGGSYDTPQAVTITCTTDGAEIHYTLDGSVPTESSQLYDGTPVQIDTIGTTVLTAKAFKNSWIPSEQVSHTYTILTNGQTVATPSFRMTGGTYNTPQAVTMNCATDGAVIHYTVDGSVPSESSPSYDGTPVWISGTGTTILTGKAFKSGWIPSEPVSHTYTINSVTVIFQSGINNDPPTSPNLIKTAQNFRNDLSVQYNSASLWLGNGNAGNCSDLWFYFPQLIGSSAGQIPANAKIVSARLVLTFKGISGNRNQPRGLKLFQISDPDAKGAPHFGSSGLRNGLDFQYRDHRPGQNIKWKDEADDITGLFEGVEPIDSYEFIPSGLLAEGYGEIRLDVTGSIKSWLTGAPNQGWFLSGDQAGNWGYGDGVQFYGVTATEIAGRPKLEVTYLAESGDNVPPEPVSGLTATPGNQQAQLNWTNPTGDFSGVIVLHKVGVIPTDPTDGTVVYDGLAGNILDNQGLVNGKTYYYAVFAYDNLRNYSRKTWIKATPVMGTATPPNAPSGLTVNLSANTIGFNWTDNSGNENWFVIEQQEAGGAWVPVAYPGSNQFSLAVRLDDPNFGLKPDIVYQYRIKAVNAFGDSGYAVTTTGITTPGFPAAPTNLIWTIISAGRVNLSWTDNATNETGYRVDVCRNDTGEIRSINLPANANFCSVTGLTPGVKYLFKIVAINPSGENTVWTDIVTTAADFKGGLL